MIFRPKKVNKFGKDEKFFGLIKKKVVKKIWGHMAKKLQL